MLLLWLACSDTSKEIDQSITEEDSCVESAQGVVPADAVWIQYDGQSSELFSLADGTLDAAWQGTYGTYNLNTVAFEGANGFLLERPGTVVAAQVKWSNLPAEILPIPLNFWPDFGSDGYVWDSENPYTSETRCLDASSNGEWVEYVLPIQIEISQPLHVFAGYHRNERIDSAPVEPEIMLENFQMASEPYHAGAWFLGVEDELYHLGMTSPWYTWQIRLAVVYDEPIPAEEKDFSKDADFHASSRVAFGDFDNDGDEDVMSSGFLLLENQGDGTFVDRSEWVFSDGSSNGGVWGDYDNDGCLDYLGQGVEDVLLRNTCNVDGEGYRFVDVTVDAGIHDIQSERDCDGNGEDEASPTEGSAWFDLDNDGWLDLYLANYECSSDFDYFRNYDDKVWRNNGDGTFSDWTSTAQVPQSNQAGRGATTIDIDFDGDMDLFVSNYRLDPNFFFENQGDGRLKDISIFNGTKGKQVAGAYGHTIGSAFGDVDNDGDFDLIQANLAHPFYYWFSDKSMMLINDGSGDFVDEASQRGLYYRETHSNPTFFDADNDGDLDLFITSVYSSRDSDFYENDGQGYFTLRNYESGLVQRNGWGAAAPDIDNDGDLDLVAYDLFVNDGEANNQNWLQVQVMGGISGGPNDEYTAWRGMCNVAGIGTIIEIQSDEGSQLRHVSGGSGTGVQDSLRQHFGVGSQTVISEITVHFTGGETVSVENVQANQVIWIHEDGSIEYGLARPDLWNIPQSDLGTSQ